MNVSASSAVRPTGSAAPVRLASHLASAFVAEGVDTVFGLMGDANMTWMAAMAGHPGMHMIHARHEGAAVAMATGYARRSGEVGVASVTCGPGLTHALTSLATAVRARMPLVVYSGDTPAGLRWHPQDVDQEAVVRSVGAELVRLPDERHLADVVARTFYRARASRGPVVLSIPFDLQDSVGHWEESPFTSDALMPRHRPVPPAPEAIAEVVELIREARRPVLVAGAGAVSSAAREVILELARRTGAAVGTTLQAKDLFSGEGGDLGVVGGLSSTSTRDTLSRVDLVIGLGARLGHFTSDGGTLFPAARVVRVDLVPAGVVEGGRTADVHVQADVALAVTALLDGLPSDGLPSDGAPAGPGGNGVAPDAVRSARPDPDPGPQVVDGVSVLDPRVAVSVLNAALPGNVNIVSGVGHFWNFLVPGLDGRSPSNYHFTHEFACIGQGLPTGIGSAMATAEHTVIIEGDGSLLMNLQELETIGRHRLPVLVVVMNDGAYGAEYHKLVAKALDPAPSVHGWTDFAAAAEAHGIRGRRPRTASELHELVTRHIDDPTPTLIDVRIDYRRISDQYDRALGSSSPAGAQG